jgi:GNAT superfamily N-acetyltransferase
MQFSGDCVERWREEMAAAARQTQLKIRRARRSDAPRIAELSGQLGYPSTTAQIVRRWHGLKPAALHAVFVADLPGSGVSGWLHVSVAHLVDSDTRAEVNALVVAEGQRSLGAGAQLLDAAEAWARRHGCGSVNLRSNVIRERAHNFYERQGYEHYKTQKTFRKTL